MANCKTENTENDNDKYWYRLLADRSKVHEEYDKLVIMLSGGALGLSLVLVDKVIGQEAIREPGWLICAWVMWALSLTSLLISLLMSMWAYGYAIKRLAKKMQCQAESKGETEEIFDPNPGGCFDKFRAVFNVGGAVLFILGLIMMIIFVSYNLGGG